MGKGPRKILLLYFLATLAIARGPAGGTPPEAGRQESPTALKPAEILAGTNYRPVSREAIGAIASALESARRDLQARLEGTCDRKLRALFPGPEGPRPEFRKALEAARTAADLDFLAGVTPSRGAAAARIFLPTNDITLRALAEENPAAREILTAAVEGGQGAFAAVPAVLLGDLVRTASGRDGGPGTVLLMLQTFRAGPRSAYVGGIRIDGLGGKIRRALDEAEGSREAIWSAFLLDEGPGIAAMAARAAVEAHIAAGEGAGQGAAPGLLDVLRSGPAREALHPSAPTDPEDAGGAGCPRFSWLPLHDARGRTLGGIWAFYPPPSIALSASHALKLPSLSGPALWAVLGGTGLLAAVLAAASFAAGRRRHRHLRQETLVQVQTELSSNLRSAERRLADPGLVGPMLERSIERAVQRSGGNLACAIGECLATTIASRMSRGSPARLEESKAPGFLAPVLDGSALDLAAGAVLDERFPLAVFAVGPGLDITAWNAQAERLWGAPARDRLGKPLDAVPLGGLEGEVRGMVRRALKGGTAEPALRLSFDRERVYHVQIAVLPVRSLAGEDGTGSGTAEGGAPRSAGDAAPAAAGAVVIATDVSEKTECEISSKILGQYQRALSASLPIPVAVIDTEGRVMSWNGAAEGITGIAEKDVLGKEITGLSLPQGPRSIFPFRGPDGSQRGSIHIFGLAQAVFDELKSRGPGAKGPAAPAPAQAQAPAGPSEGVPAAPIAAGTPTGALAAQEAPEKPQAVAATA